MKKFKPLRRPLSPFQLIVTRNGTSTGRILSGGKPISLSGYTKPFQRASKIQRPTPKPSNQIKLIKSPTTPSQIQKRRVLLTPNGVPAERPYLERRSQKLEFKKRRMDY